jgi:hypothetical protein
VSRSFFRSENELNKLRKNLRGLVPEIGEFLSNFNREVDYLPVKTINSDKSVGILGLQQKPFHCYALVKVIFFSKIPA